jgi:hypothetical protein
MATITKQVTTIVFSLAIVGMLFGIFVLVFNDNQKERVRYIVDGANTCDWEQEVIVSSTEVSGDLEIFEIEAANEQAFIIQSAADKACVARLGEMRGSYATELNVRYENQQ